MGILAWSHSDYSRPHRAILRVSYITLALNGLSDMLRSAIWPVGGGGSAQVCPLQNVYARSFADVYFSPDVLQGVFSRTRGHLILDWWLHLEGTSIAPSL